MALIELHDIRKTYSSSSGDVHALDGLDLTVEEGTVRGLLGPNGAGKTTTVKVLTTLTRPTSGTATVAGRDVMKDAAAVRRIIGASGQYATIDEELSARENLLLIGRLFHLGDRKARHRGDELLELFDLTAAADRPVKGFSGGMRRRADLAASLVSDPKILFLDEPTTGLDPVARMNLWEVIRARVAAGTTLLLTTQYLEEADQLADEISVIDRGTVIAEGTADELKARVGGQSIRVTLQDPADVADMASFLARLSDQPVDVEGRTASITVADGVLALERTAAEIRGRDIAIHDIGVARPTLDDVFLTLTGEGNR
ncbi:ATP-binding cassette domain-containing protein [uncultured Corynebacterium sp.]|uniref:ATP-binding cassette domain-containing protein n=1 Tax=uncultured Corynebacterium sp. TaxID=159447 RepID=UPI0025D3DEE6|nr:ATP-binding cassette domain-containing protein [uncultured Corynebacterium sp.]